MSAALAISRTNQIYIPKPDEVTPRNLTVQNIALLGIALGIGTGLFTAHWIVAIGLLTLSGGLYYVSKNIDVLRVPTDIRNHQDWEINWLLLSLHKNQLYCCTNLHFYYIIVLFPINIS